MHYHHIICTLILLLFLSCSTTRNLPEDETLYTGIKRIEYVNDSALAHSEEALDEVEAALAYPPNNAIFGSSTYRFPLPFKYIFKKVTAIGCKIYNVGDFCVFVKHTRFYHCFSTHSD